MMEPSCKRPKVDAAAIDGCCANDVLSLQWVDVDAETREVVVADVVPPSFSHAFFGEEEQIRGYEGLKVTLSIDRASFYAMIDVAYEKREDDADDVRSLLREHFEYDFVSTADAFVEHCLAFRTMPLGLDVFGDCSGENASFLDGSLVVTHTPLRNAHARLKEMHYRLEPFLMFFIDGFQCIDTTDPDWTLFCAVFQRQGDCRLVGYTAVYQYYAYPDGHRDRIGQMFVLPGYRRKGIGNRMMEAVYAVAKDQKAIDISIEDPTETVSTMKHMLDMKNLLNCQWVHDALQEHQMSLEASKEIKTSLTKSQIREIHSTLRIPLRDVDLLWSALLLTKGIGIPEKTHQMSQHLLRQWKAREKDTSHHKVFLQELGPNGEPSDNFVMMPCRHDGMYKILHGVMVMPTESCPVEEEEKERLLQQKLSEALTLASHFVHRHSSSN